MKLIQLFLQKPNPSLYEIWCTVEGLDQRSFHAILDLTRMVWEFHDYAGELRNRV